MQQSTDKLDRRRAYSRQAIQKALKRLQDTTPLHKITVTDICREADVNRTTFYANYSGLQDLLRSIAEELDEKISFVLSQYDSMDALKYYNALIDTLSDNADACLTIMNLPDRELRGIGIDFSYSKTLQMWSNTSAPSALLPEYVLAGTRAVINVWLEQGMPLPKETIASYLYTINELLLKRFSAFTAGESPPGKR